MQYFSSLKRHLFIFTALIVCFSVVTSNGECLRKKSEYKVQQTKQQHKTVEDNNKLPTLQDKLTNQSSSMQNSDTKPVTINELNIKDLNNGAIPPPPPPPPSVPDIPTVKKSNSGEEGLSLEEELEQKKNGLKKTEQNQILSPDKKMQQEMLAMLAKFNKNKEKNDNINNNNVLKDNKKDITPVYNQQQYKPVKKVILEKPKLTRQEQLVILDNTYNNMMELMKQLEKIMEFSKNESIVSDTNSMKYKLEQKEQLNKLNNIYNNVTKSMRTIKETITNFINNK